MTHVRRTSLLARALAVAATVLVAVLGVAGVAASAPRRAPAVHRPVFPNRPTRVLVLGDSVIKGAEAAIPAALPGRQVTEDAVVSRSTGATAAAAATYGADWDVVVILVAHNDGGSPGAYQPPYRQMLDQFARVPRVVLLTLHEVRPYYATVNAFLRAQAASRPNVQVADWNAVATANPGATGGDGLHLSGGGARLMADLVAGQVVDAEQAAVPPPTTTTTTTAPPTTTTLPPTTTTTEAVELIPATSIVQDPPTTTTTAAPKPVAERRPRATGGMGTDDRNGSSPRWIWPTLVVAMAVASGGLAAVARRLPT
ncbi:hypothetical protein KSP35_21845 [Aquihabitans sp. G128]|uniref:hypothetical protein n=1 Tax=Aquihabitans sp. G128 TaxID=2849779 RepID=UPI001C21AB89|nr:hypothetical protein [Aquihabitans sp. G128]QXC60925.1 hypothetical protein KSP35_21845 [Aquihabitans sp. G128]